MDHTGIKLWMSDQTSDHHKVTRYVVVKKKFAKKVKKNAQKHEDDLAES